MRPPENYRPHITAAFGLTLAVLAAFQVYILREPQRIQLDGAADLARAVAAGEQLFSENCASCHGKQGEGGLGPTFNEHDFLASTSDETLFSLTRTGVPGTLMPAWGQNFGGPLTDEHVASLVAFIRAWEPTAPDIEPVVQEPDPVRGATIYGQTCFVCHGENGFGTEFAPALNDPERLRKLDDAWYRSTIAHGRPAKGMPTWGTVLSPMQINDLVAMIGVWRDGKTVSAFTPLSTLITSSLFALREFDKPDAVFFLEAARAVVDSQQAAEIEAIITLIEENHLFEAQSLLISFLPPEEMGRALFDTNCSPCHGSDGTGGMGPSLHANAFIGSASDLDLLTLILDGRSGTAMDGFSDLLGEDEIINLILVLRDWQE